MIPIFYSSILIFILCSAPLLGQSLEYRAERYVQDAGSDTIQAKGKAWVRKGDQEVSADEIEIFFKHDRAIAVGNVYIRDGQQEIWCSRADYALNGRDAILDNATITFQQSIITGSSIRKIEPGSYEIDDGTYSNCNTSLARGPLTSECATDWKISARTIRVKVGGYAHFQDATIQIKDLPLLYLPYFIVPVKSDRQTGFLMPSFLLHSALGGGVSLPFFWAMGPWQDLTMVPTQYWPSGYHFGVHYRYIYDPLHSGNLSLFFTKRRFGFPNLALDDPSRSRFLGVAGEGAILLQNRFQFTERSYSQQIIRWVSNPYYTVDYGGDLGRLADLAALRSQVTGVYPTDNLLIAGAAEYQQSLVTSKNQGSDRGAASKLPFLMAAKTNGSLLDPLLSYEVDTRFENFYRRHSFDEIPLSPPDEGTLEDLDKGFDSNDLLRTGQRIQVEPRLVTSVPLSSGIQFQPLLKSGTLLYHFPLPQSSSFHREYLDLEVPFSLHLRNTYSPGTSHFEKVAHVFQPRLVYARNVYQTEEPDHPFFLRDENRLISPRFDLTDRLFPFEYVRAELINRFIRKGIQGRERFLWFQLSQQYNLKTHRYDPRLIRPLGPVELVGELKLLPIIFQIQAEMRVERDTTGNLPYSVSSSLLYQTPTYDRVRLETRLHRRLDVTSLEPRDQLLGLGVYKTLPLFFDIMGNVDYSIIARRFLNYELTFLLASKPRSCWGIDVTIGRDELKNAYSRFNYRLHFGNPGAANPL